MVGDPDERFRIVLFDLSGWVRNGFGDDVVGGIETGRRDAVVITPCRGAQRCASTRRSLPRKKEPRTRMSISSRRTRLAVFAIVSAATGCQESVYVARRSVTWSVFSLP